MPANAIGAYPTLSCPKYFSREEHLELKYTLTNPNESCRVWLQDLDYGANEWKK